jgi:hypothetical protein
MDYQAWLKVFSAELSHQKPGVTVDDLDPLFLQSLFQHGTSPVEAVNKALVLRGYKLDQDHTFLAKAFRSVRWDYLIPAAALVAVAFVVVQSKNSINLKEEAAPAPIRTSSAPKGNGDFFALGDVSYATPYSSNFRQATGKPTRVHYAGHITSQVSQTGSATEEDQAAGSSGGNSLASTASLGTGPSLDLPVVQITTTRTGSGSSGPASTTPDIQSFQVTTTGTDSQGYVGEVTWTVTNGQSVQLYLQGQQISGATGLVSAIPFAGLPEGSVFSLRVINNGKTVEQNAMVEPPTQSATYQP